MGLDVSRHQAMHGEKSDLVTVFRQVPRLLNTVAHLDYLLGEALLAPGEEQLEHLNANSLGGSS